MTKLIHPQLGNESNDVTLKNNKNNLPFISWKQQQQSKQHKNCTSKKSWKSYLLNAEEVIVIDVD